MDNDSVPSDLAALKAIVDQGGLPPLPNPPPGRRLVYSYDKRTLDIRSVRLSAE